MSPPFLAGLVVAGRRCVIIGGDAESADKTARLAEAGAVLRVIAPKLDAGFDTLRATGIAFEWIARAATDSDLLDAFLVIHSGRDENRSRHLFALATSDNSSPHRFLLCCIDQPEYCTVTNVAVVRRGPLQIGIATGGAAPTIAARIRAAMESQLGADLAAFVAMLGRLRESLPPAERRARMQQAVEGFEWKVSYTLPPSGASPGTDEPEHPLR